MPPPMNTTNGATAGWRLAAEGGGPLCNERLDGAVGPRFGVAGGRRAGGWGPVERHGVQDAWRGRRSAGLRWRGWTPPVDLGTTGEEGNRQ
jgi:hypothetical protein